MPGYDPGMQRHHLLPMQLLRHPGLRRMFDRLHGAAQRFDNFRRNGLLLPCAEAAALRSGLPLHRGPHRLYSALVAERVGRIEAHWSVRHAADPDAAAGEARMRLGLLQRALARLLLQNAQKFALNRRDPRWQDTDFSELDAMADSLWADTAVKVLTASPAFTSSHARFGGNGAMTDRGVGNLATRRKEVLMLDAP